MSAGLLPLAGGHLCRRLLQPLAVVSMAPTPKPQAVKKAADSPGPNGAAPKSGAKDLSDSELKQLKSGGAKAKVARARSHSRRSPRPPRTPHGHAPVRLSSLARSQPPACHVMQAACLP